MHLRASIVACAAVAAIAGCASNKSGDAHLYDGFAHYHRDITTDSREAQKWFDQGLVLTYGFNHAEAIRSFHKAAELDPDSPMPWWGVAYAHGMNINDAVMTEDRWRAANDAAQEAMARVDNASPAEAALIKAISTRYSWPAPAEQRTLDLAYAHAMGQVWRRYPNDPDVGALYAESLMDLQPWDYWTNEGDAKGRADEIVAALERVMEMMPDHPGAMHFYIHAVESSQAPDRAVAAADTLLQRIPGSGHLVHMPSHIYVRVGRYADAADSNTMAVAADRSYFQDAPEPDLYWIYYAHNLHFLGYAAMMEGRYETAIKAARELERDLPEDVLRAFGMLIEGIMPTTYHVLIRFGKWEEILAEPQRPEYRYVSRAVHHYARSIAFSALGRTEEARAEVDAFETAVAEVPEGWMIFNNSVDTVLPIARAMLEGELAFREGRLDDAFAALREGVALEDALVYDEPPGWMLPMRHPLGAFLMSSGRYAEAEAVYREDLKRNRGNGWSLLGLQQALTAQGKIEEAGEIGSRLVAAWPRSDINATSSCMCEPRPQWMVRPSE